MLAHMTMFLLMCTAFLGASHAYDSYTRKSTIIINGGSDYGRDSFGTHTEGFGGFGSSGPHGGAGGYRVREHYYETRERYTGSRAHGDNVRFGGRGPYQVYERFGSRERGGDNGPFGSFSRYGGSDFPGNKEPSRNTGKIHISFGRYEDNEMAEDREHFGDNKGHGSSGGYGGWDFRERKEQYESGRTYGGNGRQESRERYGNNGGSPIKQTADDGCDIESGRRLNFGETFRKGNYIIKCEKLNSNTLRLTPIKCIMDGVELSIGERKRKGGFGYACQKTDTGLRLNIVGCFGDEGEFVGFGETFPKNKFIYICFKDGDAVAHKAYGCMIEGKQVRLGETARVGPYLHKCSTTATGGIRSEVIACLDKSGNRLDIGERLRDGSFLYECKKVGSGVSLALVGCVATVSGQEREFRFGESWNTDSNSPLSYKMRCVGDETTAKNEITHCIANLDWANSVISVGNTVELPKDMVFLCRQQGDGTVTGRIVSCAEFEKSEGGYKFCGKPNPMPSTGRGSFSRF